MLHFHNFLTNEWINQWWNPAWLKLELLAQYRTGMASWGRHWQIFFVGGQILNVLGLACHMISATAIQLCCRSTNLAIDNTENQWKWPCSNKTYLWHWTLNLIFTYPNIIVFLIFSSFKNLKTILTSLAAQKQAEGQIWPQKRLPSLCTEGVCA